MISIITAGIFFFFCWSANISIKNRIPTTISRCTMVDQTYLHSVLFFIYLQSTLAYEMTHLAYRCLYLWTILIVLACSMNFPMEKDNNSFNQHSLLPMSLIHIYRNYFVIITGSDKWYFSSMWVCTTLTLSSVKKNRWLASVATRYLKNKK